MKLFVALSTLLAIVVADASAASITYYAAPGLHYAPLAAYSSHGSSLVTPVQQQYHAQDELGQYSYGYSEPLSSKQEVRTLDGVTRGSYSYRDSDNKLQTVDYVADSNGFRVAATNLPRPVPVPTFPAQDGAPAPVADTADVAAARAAHLAAHQAARMRLEQSAPDAVSVDAADPSMELPRPVQDTPEVAAAKSAHLKRVEHEKLRNEIIAAAPAVYRAPLSVAYRSAVIPGIYGYNYPLNSRFLTNYFY